MNNLQDRIVKFLQNAGHGTFIPERTLISLARTAGYSTEDITTALARVSELPEIGFKDWSYCWYSLTDAEKETYQRQLAFWNSL